MAEFVTRDSRVDAVYFATTNPVKFSQARLVLGRLDFRVAQMKRFSQPYPEPYGKDLPDFLEAGLLETLKRGGRGQLVFIEDTTVLFPELSTDGKEYPGQQTKEWFASTSLDALWGKIRAVGGEGMCVVRSDIWLSVPQLARRVHMRGEVRGRLVHALPSVEANPLYPWLGRTDFNSWFVPNGADRTLAEMGIAESEKYDHRARALNLLADRLSEYQAILRASDDIRAPQRALSVEPGQAALFRHDSQPDIVIVLGKRGAGKSTIAHYLSMTYDYRFIEGSKGLSSIAKSDGMESVAPSPELAEYLFGRHGWDAVEREVILPEIESDERPVVYVGARTLQGLAYLVTQCAERGRSTRIVLVETNDVVRFARIVERRRQADRTESANLEKATVDDDRLGVGLFAREISEVVVDNNGRFENLMKGVESALAPGHTRGARRTARSASTAFFPASRGAKNLLDLLTGSTLSTDNARSLSQRIEPLPDDARDALIDLLRRKIAGRLDEPTD